MVDIAQRMGDLFFGRSDDMLRRKVEVSLRDLSRSRFPERVYTNDSTECTVSSILLLLLSWT